MYRQKKSGFRGINSINTIVCENLCTLFLCKYCRVRKQKLFEKCYILCNFTKLKNIDY